MYDCVSTLFVLRLHIELPGEINDNKAQTDDKHGLLTRTPPKTAKAKPPQIAVQVDEESLPTLGDREGTIHGRENRCSP
jgi:hypothetical protein